MTTRRALTASLALSCWLLAATHPAAHAYGQEGHRLPRESHHLEISLPGAPRPVMTMGVRQNHRATALVRRGQLKINDPQAAEGVTAVDVWADLEAAGVRFRLSIIYNDLSDPGVVEGQAGEATWRFRRGVRADGRAPLRVQRHA